MLRQTLTVPGGQRICPRKNKRLNVNCRQQAGLRKSSLLEVKLPASLEPANPLTYPAHLLLPTGHLPCYWTPVLRDLRPRPGSIPRCVAPRGPYRRLAATGLNLKFGNMVTGPSGRSRLGTVSYCSWLFTSQLASLSRSRQFPQFLQQFLCCRRVLQLHVFEMRKRQFMQLDAIQVRE